MKTKSALSYFGSDSEVAAELAALLDGCSHVTIPFVGGGSIIPYLKARAIVANDLNNLAINFYRVISGRYGEGLQESLIELCDATLSHPSEIEAATQILARPVEVSPDLKAWAYWAQCWIGRKGKGGTKSPASMPSVRRTASGGTNASRLKAAAGDLRAWAKTFERCEWECLDFRLLIPKIADKPGCGIYVDAPWVDAGDVYLHSFSRADHIDLRYLLDRFQETSIVVRYGDCEFIRDLYSIRGGWTVIERSSRDQTNAVKGEVWFTRRVT